MLEVIKTTLIGFIIVATICSIIVLFMYFLVDYFAVTVLILGFLVISWSVGNIVKLIGEIRANNKILKILF